MSSAPVTDISAEEKAEQFSIRPQNVGIDKIKGRELG
jgi:hypothetical protein